jgi:hypothetical protein
MLLTGQKRVQALFRVYCNLLLEKIVRYLTKSRTAAWMGHSIGSVKHEFLRDIEVSR